MWYDYMRYDSDASRANDYEVSIFHSLSHSPTQLNSTVAGSMIVTSASNSMATVLAAAAAAPKQHPLASALHERTDRARVAAAERLEPLHADRAKQPIRVAEA